MARRRKPTWHQTQRWCFTVTLPDKTRKTVYDQGGIRKTEKAAAREWMEATLEGMEERRVTGGEYTVNDLRLMYLTWADDRVKADKMEPVTFHGHRKILKMICNTAVGHRAFGSLVARDLTTTSVAALQSHWEGKSPTTVRNRLASLLAVLNWAAQPRHDRKVERLIPANPIAGLEMPTADVSERYAPLEEVNAFLAFVWEWAGKQKGHSARFARMLAVLIEVAADAGCRPGELCAAKWSHLREADRTISFPPREHKTGRKTKRFRHVVIQSEETFAKLMALKEDPSRHPEFIFTHRAHGVRGALSLEERQAGTPWNSSKLTRPVKKLRRLAIAAGVLSDDAGSNRMTLYRLRHSFATDAVQSGIPISDVAGLIGNSAKVTENVYLHRQVDHLKGVAGKVRRGPQ